MSQAEVEFDNADGLIERLLHGRRPVAFLVGAPLTAPDRPGRPGVPGVGAIVDMVADQFGLAGPTNTRRRGFEQEIAGVEWAERYQRAFDYLIRRGGGVDAANAVVRDAVLRARTQAPAGSLDERALLGLEASPDGWYLGPAVKALGQICAGFEPRFGAVVLTSNFDPLIEVAVRAAGGTAITEVKLGDGTLDLRQAGATRVVHLHGFWRGDTLHTPRQLTVDRKALRSSLERLLDDHTLVVMAYGGWHDVVAETLFELTVHAQSQPDIVWCFYASDRKTIVRDNQGLFAIEGRLRGRMTCFAGVDCNQVLPRLRAALDNEGALLGRRDLGDALVHALSKGSVAVLGDPYMKRSRALKWAAERAKDMGFTPVRFNARELSRAQPEALLRRVADGLGKYHEVATALQRERALPTVDDAIACLPMIAGACVLIDDADALFVAGHEFVARFFDAVACLVQARELQWMTVSRAPLDALLQDTTGSSSPLLRDAPRFYAGALDRDETAIALRARLGHEHAERSLAAAGTLPHLVYRLTSAEWGDVAGTLDKLPSWAEGLCAVWWDRPSDEQELLLRCVDGLDRAALDAAARASADELVGRGLLVDTSGILRPNGGVWTDYLRARRGAPTSITVPSSPRTRGAQPATR